MQHQFPAAIKTLWDLPDDNGSGVFYYYQIRMSRMQRLHAEKKSRTRWDLKPVLFTEHSRDLQSSREWKVLKKNAFKDETVTWG